MGLLGETCDLCIVTVVSKVVGVTVAAVVDLSVSVASMLLGESGVDTVTGLM